MWNVRGAPCCCQASTHKQLLYHGLFRDSGQPPPRTDAPYNRLVSQAEHKAQAPSAITCFGLTVSDTRTPDTDTGGRAIRQLLEGAGHHVAGATIVRDDPSLVRQAVEREVILPQTQAIIITGGTGLTSRDSSYEAVVEVLEKRLDGFGELFRMLSFQDIGPAAMMSRAVAGTAGRTAIFLLPGSEQAVRLAMERLILPELGHVVQQLNR